jgi:hypothetical protein
MASAALHLSYLSHLLGFILPPLDLAVRTAPANVLRGRVFLHTSRAPLPSRVSCLTSFSRCTYICRCYSVSSIAFSTCAALAVIYRSALCSCSHTASQFPFYYALSCPPASVSSDHHSDALPVSAGRIDSTQHTTGARLQHNIRIKGEYTMCTNDPIMAYTRHSRLTRQKDYYVTVTVPRCKIERRTQFELSDASSRGAYKTRRMGHQDAAGFTLAVKHHPATMASSFTDTLNHVPP